jgi:hypothetical protein
MLYYGVEPIRTLVPTKSRNVVDTEIVAYKAEKIKNKDFERRVCSLRVSALRVLQQIAVSAKSTAHLGIVRLRLF